MLETRRRAYLEVMGYDIWSAKPAQPDANRLLLQPGNGDVLMVCDAPNVSAGPLAEDIARALGDNVVWAWSDPEGRPENPTLEEAIEQQLFSRVILFGSTLPNRFFKNEIPLVLGSARIVSTHSLDDLLMQGSARLSLWKQLSGKLLTQA